MSVVEYENDSKTGRNLSAAAALLLVAGTNLSYEDEIFPTIESPSHFVRIVKPLVFDLEESAITEYTASESPAHIDDIDEEIIINLKMPPVKSYKRKVKIVKKVDATPRINIPELV